MELNSYIRDIPDFPSQGILFKDITPLLKDAGAFAYSINALDKMVVSRQIDKVVGMESRGFFFAPVLASLLQSGFVPVRKHGKLPAKTLSRKYALEYGEDSLEIHKDSISKGDKVLIHDDVLATGGTAKAVCEMVEALGGEIVQCLFLIELESLSGREILRGYQVDSLMRFT